MREGGGFAKGDEGVGVEEEGESDDGDSDVVGGEGKALGFGELVAVGVLDSKEGFGSKCAVVSGVEAEDSSRVLLDPTQEETASVFLENGNDVRSPGVIERPRTSTEPWCSRFGGASSKGKVGFGDDPSSCTSVFVGNIPPSLSHKNLRSWFSSFGLVVDVYVSQRRSRIDGSRFYFVGFRNQVDAIGACAEVDGMVIEGFQVVANLARFVRSRHVSNSAPNGVAANKACGLNLSSGVAHQSKVGVFGKFSFAQVLKSGAKSVGILSGSSTVLPESGMWNYEEDATSLAAIISNNSGSVCYSKNQVTEVARFGVANCVSMDHRFESCSGKWIYAEPLDYTGCSPLPFESQYAQVMTEDEIRGWPTVKSCDLLPENEITGGILDEADPFDVGKADLTLFGTFDTIAVGLSSQRLGCGADVGSSFDLRVFEGSSYDGNYHSPIIGDGSANQEYSQMEDSEVVENEVQFSDISSPGKVEYDKVDDSGTFLKVVCPMSDSERIEFSKHVRFIVHDALQIGKEMGVSFSPRDERMIKRFSILKQLDREKWRMSHDVV